MAPARSYAHAVRPMSRLELALVERFGRTCKASRTCLATASHVTSYEFIAAEGRPNRSERHVCAEHARVFAERYTLRIPRVLPETI